MGHERGPSTAAVSVVSTTRGPAGVYRRALTETDGPRPVRQQRSTYRQATRVVTYRHPAGAKTPGPFIVDHRRLMLYPARRGSVRDFYRRLRSEMGGNPVIARRLATAYALDLAYRDVPS